MENHFEIEMRRPRELLAPSILLLLAESSGHGYELMERLRPLGFDWGGPGRIYRELRSLEDAGLVTSDWSSARADPGAGSMRHPIGPRVLDRSAAGVIGLRHLIAEFQARLQVMAPPRPLVATGPRRRRSAPRVRSGGSS